MHLLWSTPYRSLRDLRALLKTRATPRKTFTKLKIKFNCAILAILWFFQSCSHSTMLAKYGTVWLVSQCHRIMLSTEEKRSEVRAARAARLFFSSSTNKIMKLSRCPGRCLGECYSALLLSRLLRLLCWKWYVIFRKQFLFLYLSWSQFSYENITLHWSDILKIILKCKKVENTKQVTSKRQPTVRWFKVFEVHFTLHTYVLDYKRLRKLAISAILVNNFFSE